MKGALAVAVAEIRAHRIALPTGLALGAMVGLVGLVLGWDDGAQFIVAALTTQTATAVAVGVGASIVSRDLSERRLGFYLARPLPPFAYWAGKMSAALLLALASGALCATTLMLFVSLSGQHAGGLSWGGALSVASRSFMPYLGLTFCLAAAAVAGGAVRARSRLLVLDIVMLPVAFVLFLRAIGGTWNEGTSEVVIPSAMPYVLLGGTLALLLAGFAQVSLGRLDLARGHVWLSAVAWSGVLACIGGIHLFSRAVASATPGDLRSLGVSLHAPPAGDHVLLEGIGNRWAGFHPGFLLDRQGQFVRLGGLVGVTGFAWSPDGRRFAWSRDAIFGGGAAGYTPFEHFSSVSGFAPSHWIVDLDNAGAAPRRLDRQTGGPEVVRALSSGGRMLVAAWRSKLIVDGLTGETLARIAESSAWSHPRFVSETRVRALRVGAAGQYRVVEWDVAGGRLAERGAVLFQGTNPNSALMGSVTPADDYERLLRYDDTGLFLHDLDGKVLTTFVDGWERGGRSARLLSGGRIGVVTGLKPRLRIFALDGRVLAQATFPGYGVGFGGESAPGLLALAVTLPRGYDPQKATGPDRSQDQTQFLDLTTGNVVRSERELLPALGRWRMDAENPQPGSLATRMFFGPEGLVLLDPASGARSVVVRRLRQEN